MNFFETVDTRYSYRGAFTDQKPTTEEIELILKAGIAAPTGMHIQTTSYVAVTDPELIAKLGEVIPSNGMKNAPLVIVLLTEDKSQGKKLNFEIENYSASTQNILLAVTALGYATVWTDGVVRAPKVNDAIRSLLGVPANLSIRAALPIGKAAAPLAPQVKDSINDLVTFNHF